VHNIYYVFQKNIIIFLKNIIMKKLFTYTIVLCCLLLSVVSCRKQSPQPATEPEQVINAIVAPGQTYTYTPPSSGTLSINRQATHFEMSEVGTENNNSSVVYQYAPAKGYKGPDEPPLKFGTTVSYSGGGGGCNWGGNQNNYSTVTSTIIIKITVAD
jgi:hypothetical protein